MAMNMGAEMDQVSYCPLVGQDRRTYLEFPGHAHNLKNNNFFMKRCFGVGFLIADNPDCNEIMAS